VVSDLVLLVLHVFEELQHALLALFVGSLRSELLFNVVLVEGLRALGAVSLCGAPRGRERENGIDHEHQQDNLGSAWPHQRQLNVVVVVGQIPTL
jgi:hypothetical protein